MMLPLIILVCPPPSLTPLTVICLTASAHLVTAETLHLVLQNVGFADVTLQRVNRIMVVRLPPSCCQTGRRS